MSTTAARSAHGRGDTWQGATDELLSRLEPVEGANVAFVYITDRHARFGEQIRQRIAGHLGIGTVIGTIGLGVCETGIELMDEPAVSALVIRLPEEAFASLGSDDDVTPPRVAIVHADPRRATSLLADANLADTFMIGGLTASRGVSVQLRHGGSVHNGTSGLLLGSEVALRTGLTQGCWPLGPPHRISHCTGNVIVSLDGRPALSVLLDEAGVDDPSELGGRVAVGFPLPNTDTDDYIVRDLLGVDPESGAVAVAHTCRYGETLRFTRRDAEAARSDMRRMARNVLSRCPTPPVAALYFSCVARGKNLWGEPSVELAILAEELGPLPLTGFFGGGELHGHQLYGYTGVLCLFL